MRGRKKRKEQGILTWGDRTKLTKKELEELIAILVAKLVEMNTLSTDTKAAINRLCAIAPTVPWSLRL